MARQKAENKIPIKDDPEKIMISPKGHVTIFLEGHPVRIRLDFSDMADADTYLNRSLLGAMAQDGMNFNYLRVAFYFGIRKMNKSLNVRSVQQAGRMITGRNMEYISRGIAAALKASGLVPEDEEYEAEAEADAEVLPVAVEIANGIEGNP